MRLYFGGGEVPSHRKILNEIQAENIALSYMGLRRRVKFARPWEIADKFWEGESGFERPNLFLDSGGYTVNKSNEPFVPGQLNDISEHYESFVTSNLHSLAMVSEFDAMPMGRDWIEERRAHFYETLPPEKFLPIWHPEWGLDNLEHLAQMYPNVGIPATDIGGRDLVPLLNRLSANGTHLHGVGITSVDDMEAIRWSSVSSTSWVSPQQYGDTIVWTGRELKRYPKKYKDQARRRYRTLFEREGFNSAKIESDDSTELLRLSAWSWQQLVNDIERKQGSGPMNSNYSDDEASGPFAEVEGEVVDNPTEETRKSLTTVRREPVPLPVLGVTTQTRTVINAETGQEESEELTMVGVRSQSDRKCVSCFLASKCPAFEPSSNCAFDIPVQIRTRDQFTQMQNSLIEMQAQRVYFMRFAEETEGGYADPNLSGEMDRLQKMLKSKHEMETDSFSVKFEGKATGAAAAGGQGMLARLFGDNASERARALPSPVEADHYATQFIEGEVISDGR